MKKTLQLFISLCFASLWCSIATAQDIIILNNGKNIECVVKELTESYVKYENTSPYNARLTSLDRSFVSEIIIGGTTVVDQSYILVTDQYVPQPHRSNVKLNLLGIRFDALILTYEHVLSENSSIEFSPKYIGLGLTDATNEEGYAMQIGYKLQLKNVLERWVYWPDEVLDASYIRFGTGMGYTSDKWNVGETKIEKTAKVFHMGVDLGFQWTFEERLVFDLYGGGQYGGGTFARYVDEVESQYASDNYNFGDIIGDNDWSVSFGVRVGYMLAPSEIKN